MNGIEGQCTEKCEFAQDTQTCEALAREAMVVNCTEVVQIIDLEVISSQTVDIVTSFIGGIFIGLILLVVILLVWCRKILVS